MVVYLEVEYEYVDGVRIGIKELSNFRIVSDVNYSVELLTRGYIYEDVIGGVSKFYIDLDRINLNTFSNDTKKYIQKNVRRLKIERL